MGFNKDDKFPSFVTVADTKPNRHWAEMYRGGALPNVRTHRTMDGLVRTCVNGMAFVIEKGHWVIRMDNDADWIVLPTSLYPDPRTDEYNCWQHYDGSYHEVLGQLATSGYWNTFNELLKQMTSSLDVRGRQYDHLSATGKWPSTEEMRKMMGLSVDHWTVYAEREGNERRAQEESKTKD